MKQFHIISVGTSIIRNARAQNVIDFPSKSENDEMFWKQEIDEQNEIDKLIEFVRNDPRSHSAELNTFLRIVNGISPEDVNIYFVWTNTFAGYLCKNVLEKFLTSLGYKIFTGKEVSGYFWESNYYDPNYAKDEFARSISELFDRLIYLATKKKEEGFKVMFNATGGLKAHVIACSLAGFLTHSTVYYMNEDFSEVINLPISFYLPKGKELNILKELSEGKPKVIIENNTFFETYTNEIERLENYGLIEVEMDEYDKKPFRIRITNRGKFLLKEISGVDNE